MGKIVVIGSSNTDLVIRTPRIPSPGETLIGSDFMINAGGKGANQAVAAAVWEAMSVLSPAWVTISSVRKPYGIMPTKASIRLI